MKLIKILSLVIAVVFCVSCGKDDDIDTSNNKFNIQGTDYGTPNGYLILDDGPSFTNAIMLTFLDGTMREDNINGSSISTNTNHGIVLQVRFGNTNVASEQDVVNNISNNSTYNLGDDTRVMTNILNYTDTYTHNGVLYGDPDDAGATLYEINSTGNGTLTINTFNVDLTTRTGTIDCSYTIQDENNNTITGLFIGSFEIINEF